MTTVEKTDFARRIWTCAYLTGRFRLRSWAYSDHYFDKYQFTSDPALLHQLASGLLELLPESVKIVAGVEMGGIPLCTAMSLQSGRPAVFVRKKRKDYGTERAVEGTDVARREVCLVEDVISTGGQVVLAAEEIRRAGATVSIVLCVIDRGPAVNTTLSAAGLELRPLFREVELTAAAAALWRN